jgi:hypothetical protein
MTGEASRSGQGQLMPIELSKEISGAMRLELTKILRKQGILDNTAHTDSGIELLPTRWASITGQTIPQLRVHCSSHALFPLLRHKLAELSTVAELRFTLPTIVQTLPPQYCLLLDIVLYP